MAGPAIRCWHLAEQLSSHHEVVLASTKPVSLPPGLVDVRRVDGRRLRELADWADVIILQGFVLQQHPFLGRSDRILVVDAYAPLYLEQLEQSKALGPTTHGLIVRGGVDVVNAQLARADFVMCASEKQRDLWLGTLGALGRVNPATYGDDPTLRRLLDVVPFGLPSQPPRWRAPAVKGVIDGIREQDRLVLWGGGVYNWFDPLTLLRAMALLREDRPDVKLFFMGLVHPNPDVEEMDMAGAARRLSDELGLTGASVFFNESWVPYERRADYLLEADVAVSTHQDHVETAFAFRTRVLDYLWAGVPMVLTEGDALAKFAHETGVGLTVPPDDPAALASALRSALDPSVGEAMRVASAATAPQFHWERVVEPLLAFIATAGPAPDRAGGSATPAAVQAAPLPWRRNLAMVRARVRAGGLVSVLPPVRRRLARTWFLAGRR